MVSREVDEARRWDELHPGVKHPHNSMSEFESCRGCKDTLSERIVHLLVN